MDVNVRYKACDSVSQHSSTLTLIQFVLPLLALRRCMSHSLSFLTVSFVDEQQPETQKSVLLPLNLGLYQPRTDFSSFLQKQRNNRLFPPYYSIQTLTGYNNKMSSVIQMSFLVCSFLIIVAFVTIINQMHTAKKESDTSPALTHFQSHPSLIPRLINPHFL